MYLQHNVVTEQVVLDAQEVSYLQSLQLRGSLFQALCQLLPVILHFLHAHLHLIFLPLQHRRQLMIM